jgi:tRNA G37 N-methylase Trm5
MEEQIIQKIREKKEFSYLPVSIVERVLNLKEVEREKGILKIKKSREILRKYYTVFLSNKLMKGKISDDEILKKHFSSKNRNYKEIYSRIITGSEMVIIDLGAGVNGFSFKYIKERNKNVKYIGIEALLPFVELMNKYFKKNKLNGEAICFDLFDLEEVRERIKNSAEPRTILLFNVIDALESFEWNYSKKLLLEIKKEMGDEDRIVISFPTKSLSGKTRFKAKREWILDFLRENFVLISDFEMNDERFVAVKR